MKTYWWFTAAIAAMSVVRAAGDTVIYVDDDAAGAQTGVDWFDAFSDLQDALAAAAQMSGEVCEVRVAEGMYRPDRGTLDRWASFIIPSGLSVRGGYAGIAGQDPDAWDPSLHETVLAGDLLGNDADYDINQLDSLLDNTFRVVVLNGGGIVVRGVTISSALAWGPGGSPQGGGGLSCVDWLYPCMGDQNEVIDCLFRDNVASIAGGAVAYSGTNAAPLRFTRCKFVHNWAINVHSRGGAVYADGAHPVFVNCEFADNLARDGGAINIYGGVLELENCIIYDNVAHQYGGAIHSFHSDVTLRGVTMIRNRAVDDWGVPGLGGGIFARCIDPCTPTLSIFNSILWGNQDGTGLTETSQITALTPPPFVNYSCIYGLTGELGGIGNVGDDPMFMDANLPGDGHVQVNNDVRLRANSTLINAGDPAIVWLGDSSDAAGHARVLCGRIDMGAHEFGIGDYDCSRFVDLSDFQQWVQCMTQPIGGSLESPCETFDFDLDAAIDLRDFSGFQAVFQQP